MNIAPCGLELSAQEYVCFLCNLFINVHGGFYISGSHGRSYPRWRISRFNELNLSEKLQGRVLKSVNKLNKASEESITTSMTQTQLVFPDPNESMVFVPG